MSFEQAAQSVAKGIQHISTRSQAAMDRFRDGDSSEDEEEAVPSLLFWRRSNGSSSGSGSGSRAAAAARESLGEADGFITRARQNAEKVITYRAASEAAGFRPPYTFLPNQNSYLCSRVQYVGAISLELLLARHCRLLCQHQATPYSRAAPCQRPQVSSVLSASASDSASSLMHTLGGGLSTVGQHMQDAAQNSLGGGGDGSALGRGVGARGSSSEEQQNQGASGGVAVARGTLDRVERHRLPAALFAALLAGCGPSGFISNKLHWLSLMGPNPCMSSNSHAAAEVCCSISL